MVVEVASPTTLLLRNHRHPLLLADQSVNPRIGQSLVACSSPTTTTITDRGREQTTPMGKSCITFFYNNATSSIIFHAFYPFYFLECMAVGRFHAVCVACGMTLNSKQGFTCSGWLAVTRKCTTVLLTASVIISRTTKHSARRSIMEGKDHEKSRWRRRNKHEQNI